MSLTCLPTCLQNVGNAACYVGDVDWSSLPQTLKALRKSARLTMKELAARMGVTAGAIDHYEGGRRTPDPATVDAFVQACGHVLVFEIVAPGTEVMALDPREQEAISLLRALPPEKRRALMEFGYLLPRAREGAERAALGVLRQLQEPLPDARAVGEPE